LKLSVTVKTNEIEGEVPFALFTGSFDERIQKAADLGYDGVELMTAYPFRLDPKHIKRKLGETGLVPSAIGSGAAYSVDKLSLLSKDTDTSRRAEERLRDLILFAAAVEAPLVTVGGFRGLAAWGGPDARLRLMEVMRRAADRASAEGVRLVVEPLNRYESDIIRNATEGLQFLDETSRANIGIVLDVFHMNIEEPIMEHAIKQVASAQRLWHVHLGDSNRSAPGKGHVAFAEIVTALRESNYQGFLSAELLRGDDPDRTARETIAYMRLLVAR
jgi:5-keto-L-gluconate epimerase